MRLTFLSFLGAMILAGQVKTGPAVGSAVPAFEAQDQNGRPQTLSSVAGPKGTLLVFYRSADW
jgi:hypothetical protein